MVGIKDNTRRYSHELRENYDSGYAVDMTETVFYSTAVRVDQAASYADSFYLSDLITTFRISANAFDSQGALGFNTLLIQTEKLFYIDF